MATLSIGVARIANSFTDFAISRLRRIVVVTLGLSIAGALVGAVLGVLAMAFLGLITRGVDGMLGSSVLFPAAAAFGAPAGAILGPLSAWLLLRRIPLGRAIKFTAAGTVIGFAVGCGLGPILRLGILWSISFSIVGFLASAVYLRLAAPHRERVEATGTPGE